MKTTKTRHALPVAPLTITPAEMQFIARFRTLTPDARRVIMGIFEGMHAFCEEDRMKLRPALRLVTGGQQ